jgi:hypothetical protein
VGGGGGFWWRLKNEAFIPNYTVRSSNLLPRKNYALRHVASYSKRYDRHLMERTLQSTDSAAQGFDFTSRRKYQHE